MNPHSEDPPPWPRPHFLLSTSVEKAASPQSTVAVQLFVYGQKEGVRFGSLNTSDDSNSLQWAFNQACIICPI